MKTKKPGQIKLPARNGNRQEKAELVRRNQKVPVRVLMPLARGKSARCESQRQGVRIKVRMPAALKRAVEEGAKRLNVTLSEFLALAIRERLRKKAASERSLHAEDANLFFIAEAIRHARTLPTNEAQSFLLGMFGSLDSDHPAKRAIAHAFLSYPLPSLLDRLQLGQYKVGKFVNEKFAFAGGANQEKAS